MTRAELSRLMETSVQGSPEKHPVEEPSRREDEESPDPDLVMNHLGKVRVREEYKDPE